MTDFRPRKVVRREEIRALREAGAQARRAGMSRAHGPSEGAEFLNLQHWQSGWDDEDRRIQAEQGRTLAERARNEKQAKHSRVVEIADCLERAAALIRELAEEME